MQKGNSRTHNCSQKITQVYLVKIPKLIGMPPEYYYGFGSRRANNHNTQRKLLFRVVSSNADTMTATSTKDCFELTLVLLQDSALRA